MKIAFIYGPFSTGSRHFDFLNLWSSSRGLTGSEVSCIQYATALARKGHQVSLFTYIVHPSMEINGVHIRSISELPSCVDDPWDVAISWNEPDELRVFSPNVVRITNQQLNDFTYCRPRYDESVDVYTSPSNHHMQYIRNQTPSPDKWTVLPNGCYPSLYSRDNKVPGRMIWASSCDRGLHLLLEQYGKIKKAAPHAHLKIFYNFDFSRLEHCDRHISTTNADIMEIAQRSRYIREALPRLKHLGVELIGSISRNQMVQEMNQAEVLPFPCDTVRYTEGFSVTTMEACAAAAVPVLGSCDALPELYEKAAVMVPHPAGRNAGIFSDLVIRTLTDTEFRNKHAEKCFELAQRFSWDDLSDQLESIIINAKERK